MQEVNAKIIFSMHHMQCCTRDGGGPSEAALQEEALNYRKVLQPKSGVLNVTGRRGKPHVW